MASTGGKKNAKSRDKTTDWKPNSSTSSFIEKVKELPSPQNIDVIHHPPTARNINGMPQVLKYETKAIVLVAPSKQIPGWKRTVICRKCKKNVSLKGWHPHYRKIEDLEGHMVLVQEQYQCQCSDKNRFSGNMLSYSTIYSTIFNYS
jgi:hypothetical protein